MPTYEYACAECDTHIEVVQHMTAPSLETCGVCGGKLRKVFHAAGILFKGSGFYSTDNRSKDKSATSETGTSSEKKDSKTDSGADSRSAKKPDKKAADSKAGSKSDTNTPSKPAKETA